MATKMLLVNTAHDTVNQARELMPPGFALVVAAPGSARSTGRIPGAGLDVFPAEPPSPSERPLWVVPELRDMVSR